jgi:dTDP-4-amino-4,6-dideoxygalactose transaminase
VWSSVENLGQRPDRAVVTSCSVTLLALLWYLCLSFSSADKQTMNPRIPFNRPGLAGAEFHYIAEAIEQAHISGNGPFTKKCQTLLEQQLGIRKALLTTSCTDALEMAALLLDIQPGDEVILPSFTFVSTANAFVLRGARPVFADIHPDTLNLDETRLERLISSRTRAIVPVHYAGVGCEMDSILRTAAAHSIPVVEDNAHGLFGRYQGKYLGTFGAMATQSFHETKNFSCGEGGALLVNDAQYLERSEILHEKGTNRTQFLSGQVDKYTWVDIGSSYVPSDLLAAFLYAQLEARDKIQAKRRRVWEFYQHNLKEWAAEVGAALPTIPSHCEQTYHMFHVLLPSLEYRQSLMQSLLAENIVSVFHYVPLHLSPMGIRFGGKRGDCPVTESVSDRLLRLPFYNDLSEAEQSVIIRTIWAFRGRALKARL